MKNYYLVLLASMFSVLMFMSACSPVAQHKTDLAEDLGYKKNAIANLAINHCASWQAIKLTKKEMSLLNDITQRYYYRQNSSKENTTDPITLYIKTLDNNFLKKIKNIENDKQDIKLIHYNSTQNKFEDIYLSNQKGGIFYQNFSTSIYVDIHDNIKKIKIEQLDNLMNDPYAQHILKFDKKGIHELFYLLGDTTETISYDKTTGRNLTIGDLANGLLMIIYGQDYWNDSIYPAPISGLYDQKFEQFIMPPDWQHLTLQQKNQAFKDEDYLKFISRGWKIAIIRITDFSPQETYDTREYGRQTPKWIHAVLELYPNDSTPYISDYPASNPNVYQPSTLKSLKIKLVTALENAENVQRDCS